MMTLYTDILGDENEDSGIHRGNFSTAVNCWAWMQDRVNVTIAEAALAFNTTPDLIRQAVEDGYWLYAGPEDEPDPSKQFIRHEGE